MPTIPATKIASSSAGKATVRLMNPATSRPSRGPAITGSAPIGMPIAAPIAVARAAIEDVAPERIGSEQVLVTGALLCGGDVEAVGGMRPDLRRDDRKQDDERDHREGHRPDGTAQRLE